MKGLFPLKLFPVKKTWSHKEAFLHYTFLAIVIKSMELPHAAESRHAEGPTLSSLNSLHQLQELKIWHPKFITWKKEISHLLKMSLKIQWHSDDCNYI